MKVCHALIALFVAAAYSLLAGEASATVISNNFSIGYGFTPTSWNTSETSSVNVDVAGDFTLGITFPPSAAFTMGAGPTFINRVLASSTDTQTEGRTDTFDVTVTAAYTGPLTGGSTRLVIDNISIYAGNHTTGGVTNLDESGVDLINWIETTVGNSGSGPVVDLGAGSSVEENPANYDLVTWNPDDFSVAGNSTTRLFDLQTNGQLLAYLEGFEIFGRVEYLTIPEPATHWLLFCGLIGLVKRTRRNRRN